MTTILTPEEQVGEYAQYKSVRRWLMQLKKRSNYVERGNIPKDTLDEVRYSIAAYTKFTDKNPDELIEDANRIIRTTGSVLEINDLVDEFWNQIPKKTSGTVMYSFIRAFYRHNGITLTSATPKAPVIRESELIPDSNIVRRHCDVAPIQHSSWILTNNYLGLRIEAITLLTVDDFQTENWDKDLPLYPVRIRRELSGIYEYPAWIGHDAMMQLKTFFAKKGLKGSDKPFGYDSQWLIKVFKKYAYEAKIVDAPLGITDEGVPKGLCPYHPQCLRKRRQTIQESVGTNQNWVDFLMGHKPRGADASNYSKPVEATPEELYQEVLKALPLLEIYGHHNQSPTKPTIELQRMMLLEQLKSTNLDADKKAQIESLLKSIRTEQELQTAQGSLQNIMVTAKRIEE
ncbi:MAG: hypothetical protein WC365_07475 [Candidatus Babeliales bacterium]|jgi:hypothetical protein